MKITHIGLILISGFIVGCTSTKVATSPTPGASVSSESQALSADTKTKLDQIQTDFGVTVVVHDEHQIIVFSGLMPVEKMSQIDGMILRAFGKDSTNYHILNVQ